MGHVDHAHQAIGDGQAQGHQQQNRTQAQASEQHPPALAPGQGGLDVAQSSTDLGLDGGIAFLRPLLVEQQLNLGCLGLGQGLDSPCPQCHIIAADFNRRLGPLQGLANVIAAFSGQGFGDQGGLGQVGLFDQGLRGFHAHSVVGTEQLQGGQSRIDLTAHAVVADHILGVRCKGLG